MSCYERQEGCLDVLASNFDLEADRDCCCEYPDLIFNIKHVMDSVNLNLNTMYTNDLGQTFYIRKLDYFISGAILTKNGVPYTVTDSLLLVWKDGSEQAGILDAIRLNKNQFDYNLGTFKETGIFDRLAFYAGLTEPLSKADPGQFESGSPLSESGNPLLDDELGYLHFNIELARDTTDEYLFQLKSSSPVELVGVELELQIEKKKGRNLVVPLEVDYKNWFHALDLEEDPLEIMLGKVMEGIPLSFSVNN